MEEELKCPSCREFLNEPVLLQCAHSYCRSCAIRAQQKMSTAQPSFAAYNMHQSPLSPQSSSSGASDTISLCVSDPDQESDKLSTISVVSETDSGVVICGQTSRPCSFVGVPSLHSATTSTFNPLSARIPSILTPSISGYTIVCDACQKPSFYSDENAIKDAPENVALRRLISRIRISSSIPSTSTTDHADHLPLTHPTCQWCESAPNSAELYCEVCGYYYCSPCQSIVHPPRGPLKDHKLLPAANCIRKSSSTTSTLERSHETKCEHHPNEILTLFCTVCRLPVCCLCLQEIRHLNHDVQSLSTIVKSQKSDLSHALQLLSEKAKHAKEDINNLKGLLDRINNNCDDFKSNINVQIDSLIEMLQERRKKLLEFADSEKEYKQCVLKEQVSRCKGHLIRTTSLIQFCIEILKEPDPIAYMQISNALSNRATNQDFLWHKEMRTKPEIDTEFVLNLDTKAVQYSVQCLDFVQLKAKRRTGLIKGDFNQVPPAPYFDTAECAAENNSVVVVWRCPRDGVSIDGYILEIDSGRDDGIFKEVYCGTDNICTIDGLHFDTIYNARVKAFNSAGSSPYSDPICLQTAHVAWFQLTKSASQHEMQLSNEFATLSCAGIDYSTVLGSVSFSKGIHYWEVTVDRHECNADIVLGVAQPSVNRHTMLGKDLHGWSIYLDAERSWYLHNDLHHGRVSGGISGGGGTVIGVLMDCDQGALSYYINDRPLIFEGSRFAFKNMPRGLYYPAFSVNRNSTITIHTGLTPPSSGSSSPDSHSSVA